MKAFPILSIVAVTLLATGCEPDEPFYKPSTPESIQGNWKISKANINGIDKAEWQGVRIAFIVASDSTGSYWIMDSPDFRMWSPRGSFSAMKGNSFKREDALKVRFSASTSRLELETYYPWLVVSTCDSNGNCSPSATGHAIFDLYSVD